MSRTVFIGVFFLSLLMLFLFLHMRSEKMDLYSNEFTRFHAARIYDATDNFTYDGNLNDPKIIDGNLCFKRFDNQTIICLDQAGKLMNRWGNVSEGVDTFAFIVNWAFDDGVLSVIDGRNNAFYQIDSLTNQILSRRPLNQKVIRALAVPTDSYVVKTPAPGNYNEEIFQLVNLESGTTLAAMDLELPDFKHRDFTLDGYFVSNGRENFHICYKTGLFQCFNNSGKMLYSSKTIDETGPPEILISAEGAKRYHPLTQRINRSAFATKDMLLILSGRRAVNDLSGHDAIDCYDATTGKYKETLYIPYHEGQAAFDIFGTSNRIYATYGKQIVSYEAK